MMDLVKFHVSYSCCLIVEDGTQGLHYCRVEKFNDNPTEASEIEELNGLAQQGKERAM
jgi:hypothetical protein